jgi:hypothetical protein
MDKLPKKYIFIDESGDPVFYGNRRKLLVGSNGFQPYLIIGFIEAENRKSLRKEIVRFIENIKSDVMYNTIPSVAAGKGWYVHARGDHPEIRAKFFECIRNLKGYQAHIAIAKKDLEIFSRKHNNNATEFYFDVLHHLLKNKFTDSTCTYHLYLSQRGNNTLHQFKNAVDKALAANEEKVNYNLEIVSSADMPELSIIDYLMWAVQRKLLKNENRYFDALKDKFETLIYLYEDERK